MCAESEAKIKSLEEAGDKLRAEIARLSEDVLGLKKEALSRAQQEEQGESIKE